jgi:hypothetical protein
MFVVPVGMSERGRGNAAAGGTFEEDEEDEMTTDYPLMIDREETFSRQTYLWRRQPR